MGSPQKHDASAVAIAFRFQERRALFDLWDTQDDEASVAVEALDDIQVNQPNLTLIEQVKHSVQPVQPPITVKSPALWKTLRIWCELLPSIDLMSCKFVFICTSPIDQKSPMTCLVPDGADREDLLECLNEEANRVRAEIASAAANAKGTVPHKEKSPGVNAWLYLPQASRRDLLSRIVVKPEVPTSYDQEERLATILTTYPPAQRTKLAKRLLTWWDDEILRSMQGKRAKFIGYFEVVEQLSHLNAMLEKDEFFETFSSQQPPPIFHTDERLAKQCGLVGATNAVIDRARTFEWQARSQRSAWSDESPMKSERLTRYDDTLVNEWKAHHDDAIDASIEGDDHSMKIAGLEALKWALRCSASEVGTIDNYVTPPFYIRGSYQTLSIDGRVGWHPNYKSILGLEP